MLISPCCKELINVHTGNEGTSYYYCRKCNIPCDPIQDKDISDNGHVREEENQG